MLQTVFKAYKVLNWIWVFTKFCFSQITMVIFLLKINYWINNTVLR